MRLAIRVRLPMHMLARLDRYASRYPWRRRVRRAPQNGVQTPTSDSLTLLTLRRLPRRVAFRGLATTWSVSADLCQETGRSFPASPLGRRSRRDVLHSADRVICRDRNLTMTYFATLNPDSNPDPRARFVIHKPAGPGVCDRTIAGLPPTSPALRSAPARANAAPRTSRTAVGRVTSCSCR